MSSRSIKKNYCPVHNQELIMLYGCGWDYDRLLCPVCMCDYEIELETISYPEEEDVNEHNKT